MSLTTWFQQRLAALSDPFTQPVPRPTPPSDVPPSIFVPPTSEVPGPTGTTISLWQCQRPGIPVTVTEWPTGRVPLFGSNPVDVNRLSSSGIWYEAIFTVLSGTLTITDTAVGGFHKPRIVLKKRGLFMLKTVTKGVVVQAGEKLYCYFVLDDVSGPIGSNWKQANYAIHSKEIGQIAHLSAQVMRGN